VLVRTALRRNGTTIRLTEMAADDGQAAIRAPQRKCIGHCCYCCFYWTQL